jgi:HAD superfamily hydrolase (TIGR01484 family)
MPNLYAIIRSMGRPSFSGLLATDLDGTLAVEGVITTQAIRAAERLKAAGILILVVTGRNIRSLERVKNLWEVADEVLFSSGAGLLTSPGADPVERGRLSPGDVRKISAILDDAKQDYCILDTIPLNHRFSWMRHRPPEHNPDFDRRMLIYEKWGRRWDRKARAASQFLVIGALERLWSSTVLSHWSVFRSLSPLDHESIWMEVFPAGLDKGSALAERCAFYRIPPDRVMALGNDGNDESMLDWAGHPRVVSESPAAATGVYPLVQSAASGGF